MSYEYLNIDVLDDQLIKNINSNGGCDDQIVFTLEDDTEIKFHHQQDCCESVGIDTINGDLSSLINARIVSTHRDVNSEAEVCGDSKTTTTDTFISENGNCVTVTWVGVSNGYYSEGVNITRTT
tara:strand:- start:81 stop:452 length:372 start_codon:yes stop_codon:yes gene_type:complete